MSAFLSASNELLSKVEDLLSLTPEEARGKNEELAAEFTEEELAEIQAEGVESFKRLSQDIRSSQRELIRILPALQPVEFRIGARVICGETYHAVLADVFSDLTSWENNQYLAPGLLRLLSAANLERERFLAHQSADALVADEAAHPSTTASPKKWLTSWADIAVALGMKPKEQDKIKSLNERLSGPIPKPDKGKQPIVDHAVLLEWWNSLALIQQEMQNQRDGRRLSAEGHQYGKDGTVAPEIDGSVRKRRGDTKT